MSSNTSPWLARGSNTRSKENNAVSMRSVPVAVDDEEVRAISQWSLLSGKVIAAVGVLVASSVGSGGRTRT